MAFKEVYKLDELWEGDMVPVDIDGHEVLLVHHDGGGITAFQGMCPHQDIPLCEGSLKNGVLMCRAHLWSFDIKSGQGLNPGDCRLARYPVRVENDSILVDTDGVQPTHAIG